MITPKAAVFDLDGTLLYTLEDLAESLNDTLAEEGLPVHGLDIYKLYVGNGLETLVARSLPEALRRPEFVRPVLKNFAARYRERQCLKTRPYEGIAELLAALRARSIPLGVLSNKAHLNTMEVVDNFFPGVFQVVLGLRTEVPPKPDPSGAIEIAEHIGLAPDLFLYLGDSDVDMKTALAAGMAPVGALWGYRGREELAAAGARLLIEKPEDFLPLFDEAGHE